ncbi:MAG: protein translocase subunit SecD [Planctomycetota bacterium]|jgi:SecD/SecF fusion protein
MIENARRQVILVLLITIAAVYLITASPFKLGVDLRGGTQLIYEVDIEEAKREGIIPENASEAELGAKITEIITVLQDRIDPQGVTEASVTQRGDTGIIIELPDMVAEEAAAVERRIENLGQLEMRIVAEDTYRKNGVAFNIADEKAHLTKWLDDNDGEYRRLLAQDPLKISIFHTDPGPLAGRDKLQWAPAQIRPSLDNEEIWSRADSRSADSPCVPVFTDAEWNSGLVPADPPGVVGEDGVLQPFLIEFYPINLDERYFTGDDLNPAGVQPTMDDNGLPAIGYEIINQRAGEYADWSEEYIDKRSAIILNGYVQSAPTFVSRIPGSGRITSGEFSQAYVNEMVRVLRTGSLDIRPVLQSRVTIGPTLGQASIDRGFYSIAGGGLLVLLFILAYYRTAGLVAFFSLMLNIFLILGVMQFIRATFTLPGIGGLVLTMGMAVDANILIYERIREELARGKDLLQAVRSGFDRAMVTILDANITTFLAGLVLFNIGVGPIRGFAVTLMVGILTSLFTAFFVSRLSFHFLLEWKKLSSFKAASWFKSLKFDFLRLSKPAFAASMVLIVAGLANMFSTPRDVVQGLDFTGGANLHVVLGTPETAAEIRGRLESDEKFSSDFPRPRVNTLGEVDSEGKATEFSVRIKLTDTLRQRYDEDQRAWLQQAEATAYTPPYYRELERILADVLVPPAFGNAQVVPNPGGGSATASITLNFARPVALASVQERLRDSDPNIVVRNIPGQEGDVASEMVVDEWNVKVDLQAELLPEMIALALGTITDPQGVAVRPSDPIPEAEEIGGRMVDELRNAAIGALLVAMFLIVMFIRIRFHEYKYGFAAVAALLHDVLITLGIVVLFNAMGWVEAELNLAMIAAFLTIIGYSINDTIVIFDRVRENINEQKRLGEPVRSTEILNRSINQTLSRTILTTTTTLFVVLTQFVVNYGQGSALEGFSFALVIGLLSGTYSTIFIASPLVNWMQNRETDPSGSGSTKPAAAGPASGAA